MPKRGFTNIFRKEFNIVNLEKLAALGETTITPDVLRKAGVIKTKHPVKILGDGELTIALTVHAHKFSKSAQEKITKAGGKFEVSAVNVGETGQHLSHSGPAQAHSVHAGLAGGVPPGRTHSHAGSECRQAAAVL